VYFILKKQFLLSVVGKYKEGRKESREAMGGTGGFSPKLI
jgi:hypothetical protein